MKALMTTARKALVAGVGAAGLALGQSLVDGQVTQTEWAVIAGALVVGVATYLVPNRATRR